MNTTFLKIKKIFTIFLLLETIISPVASLLIFPNTAKADFNSQINYQGKLTNSSNVAVSDGTYHMRFYIYNTTGGATTSALWTENRSTATGDRITVTNGLFSVMLGSSSPLTNLDFNQTLYLGIEVGGSAGSPVWDGEMSPRKILGAVPAAFVAQSLDGATSTQFVRTDTSSTISTSSVDTTLTINQRGTGNVFDLQFGGVSFFTAASSTNIGIGTTSPYKKLSVAGDIVSDSIFATSTLVDSIINRFTFQNATGTSATTTSLAISSISNGLVKALGGGSLVSAVAGIDYQSPISATFPVLFNSNVISLGFGTTTNNLWGGEQTFFSSTTLQTFTGTNYLALGSTTLQNFTFANATGSQATTTNFFSTNGTFTNLFATTLNLTNLLVNGSTTLQNFTAQNATTTSATTTNLYISGLASTSELRANTALFGGFVGIGSTTPSQLLSVGGNTYITGGVGIGKVNTSAGTLETSGLAGIGASLYLRALLNCNAPASSLQTDASGQVSCGTITAIGGTSAGGWTWVAPNRLQLATTSDLVVVGTGSSTPYAKFFISSGATATTTLGLAAVSGQTSNILDIYDNSTNLTSVITASGLWGLGTATPLSRLAVSGGASIGANYNTAAPTNGLIVEGNVGIGTNNPGTKLDVAGTIRGTNLWINGSTTLQNFTAQNATTTNATTTNLYVSGLASTTEIRANVGYIGNLFSTQSTFTNLLVNGSTTLQNFTAQNATTTNATTTNLYVSGLASTTEIRVNIADIGSVVARNLLANGSTTLQAFTATQGTITSATSTNSYITNLLATGSTTLQAFTGTNYLALGSTTLQNFTFQNATGTSATTTNLYTSGQTVLAGAGGNVGIGISVPAKTLHVSGTGLILDNNLYFWQKSNTGTANGILRLDNTNDFNIAEGGEVADVLFKQTGNVGIGTTTPAYKLSVEGTSTLGNEAIAGFFTATSTTATSTFGAPIQATKLNITNANATSTFAGGIALTGGCITVATSTCLGMPGTVSTRWNDLAYPTASLSLGMSTHTTTFNWNTGTAANDLFRLTTDGSANGTGNILLLQTGPGSTVKPLRVLSGSTEALAVDISGNVGIGTTTPGGKLAINSASGPGIGAEPDYKGTVRILDSLGNVSENGGIEFKSNVSGAGYGWRITNPDIGGNYNNLFFQRRSNSASWTNAITFQGSTGNSSFGSTSPYARLSVWGSDTSATTKGFEVVNNASTTGFVIFNDGSMFVNGSSTLQAFTATQGTITSATSTNSYITNLLATGSTTLQAFTGTNYLALGSTTLQNFTAQNSTTTNATTTNLYVSGLASTTEIRANIGYIGNLFTTQSTFTNLLVNGSTTLQNFTFQNATGTQVNLFGTNTDGVARFSASSTAGVTMDWILGVDLSDSGKFKISSSTALGTNDRFVIDGNGNVGIGTTNPTRTLDVVSNVVHDGLNGTTSQLSIRGTADTTHKLNIGYDTTSNYGFIESVNQSVAWQNLALQPSGGNVGIGTTAPDTKLTVKSAIGLMTSSNNTRLTITGDESTNTINTAGGTNLKLNTVGGGTLVLATNNTDRLTILNDGNIGIGTTSPLTKLGVAGNAYIGGWLVATGTAQIDGATALNSTLFVNSSTTLQNFTAQNSTTTNATTTNLYISGRASTTEIRANTGLFGNVGIGTTDPTQKLDVDGKVTIGGANQGYQLDVKAASSGDSTFDTIANFYKASTNATQLMVRAKNGLIDLAGSYVTGGGGPSTQLSFSTSNSSATNEAMRIDTSGNVGIGLTNPAYKLEVNGVSSTTGLFATSATSTNSYITNLLVNGSTTLQNFTASNSTTTNATTTNLAVSANLHTSLTSGSVPFIGGSGLLTQNNSQLFWNNTTTGLGIGTTTPGGKLAIYTSTAPGTGGEPSLVGALRIIDQNGDTNQTGGIEFKSSITGAGYGWRIANPDIGGNYNNLFFQSRTNSASWTNALAFQGSTGFVGIGTTSPNNKLDIFSANADSAQGFISSSTAGAYMAWTIGTDISDSGKFKISSSTALGTNDRFVIDGNGNVGIGITNPSAPLDVRAATGWQNIQSITTTNYAYTQYANGGGVTLAGMERSVAGGLIPGSTAYAGIFGTTGANPVQFATNNAIAMTILSGGNVGIGTTGPSDKLEVVGGNGNQLTLDNAGEQWTQQNFNNNNVSKTFIALDNTNNNFIIGAQGTYATFDRISFRPDGTNDDLVIKRDGNVGIGTTGPTVNLDVYNSAGWGGVDIDGTSGGELRLQVSGTTYGQIYANAPASSGMVINAAGAGNDISFQSAGSTKMFLKDDGNVGIGTTNPGTFLQVSGSSAKALTGYFHSTIMDTTTAGTGVGGGLTFSGYKTAQSSAEIFAGIDGYKENATAGNAAGAMRFLTQQSGAGLVEWMRITSAGSVGIGTTDPLGKLHVRETVATTPGKLYITATSGYGGEIYLSQWGDADTNYYKIGTSQNNYLAINPPTGTGIILKSDGNVGIGTTNPGAKLEVDATSADATTPVGFFWQPGLVTANNYAYIGVGKGSSADQQATFGFLMNSAGSESSFISVAGDNPAAGTGLFVKKGGNVGIGTTSPDQLLTLSGPSGPVIKLIHSAGTTYAWSISAQNITSNALDITPSTAAGGNTFTTPVMTFKMNASTGVASVGIGTAAPGVNRLKIIGENDTSSNFSLFAGGATTIGLAVRNDGNVGIGTTVPVNTLQLHSAGGTDVLRMTNTGTGATSADGMFIGHSGVSATSFDFWNYENDYIRFATNNSEKVRITNAGFVGIGTTTPSANLHVATTTNARNTIIRPLVLERYDQNNPYDGAGVGILFQGYDYSNYPEPYGAIDAVMEASGTPTPQPDTAFTSGLRFYTVPTQAGGLVEKMRINAAGNVGIGQTNPTGKLHITGGAITSDVTSDTSELNTWAGINANYQFATAYWGIRESTTHSFNIDVYNANSEIKALTILQSGNVGIGTTNPAYNLDVKTSVAGAADIFRITADDDGLVGSIHKDASDNGELYVWTGAQSANIALKASGVSYINGGNVGIGTTTPTATLEVRNTSGALFRLDSTAAGGASMNLRQSGITRGGLAVSGAWEGDSSSDMSIFAETGSQLRFYTNGSATEVMTIQTGGNVGIGTTNPGTKLDVNGNTTVRGNLAITTDQTEFLTVTGAGTSHSYATINNTGGNLLWGVDSSTGGNLFVSSVAYAGVLGTQTADALQFATNNTVRTTILSDGNVGIGTTSPQNILHVNGASDGLGYIRISDGATGSMSTDGARIGFNSQALRIQNYENTNMSFFVNNTTEALTIKNDGNVGIGTTTPASTLTVQGSMTLSGTSAQPTFNIDNINSGASLGAAVYFRKSGVARWGIGTDIMSNNGTDRFEFWDFVNGASAPRMVINSTGNVGIGTTDPGAKLHISNVNSYSGIKFQQTGGTYPGYWITQSDSFGDTIAPAFILYNGAYRAAFSATGGFSLGSSYYATDPGSGNMIVQGNVGIGSTTPGSLLSIGGNGTGWNFFDSGTTTSYAKGIDLKNGGCFAVNGACVGGGGSATVPFNNLTTPTTAPSINMSTYSTVLNWTTGTGANDLFRLTTDSTSNGTGNLLFVQTGSGSTVKPLRVLAGSVEAIAVNTLGNVGIGTTNPGAKLDVSGQSNLYAVDGVQSILTAGIRGVNNSVEQINMFDRVAIGYSAGWNLFPNAPSGGLRVAGNTVVDGSVGIGTTGPTTKLNVGGADPKIVIGSVTPSTWFTSSYDVGVLQAGLGVFAGKDSQIASGWSVLGNNIYFNTGGDWARTIADEASMLMQTDGTFNFKTAGAAAADSTITWTDAMTIINSGNVGIGTTTPPTLLAVAGTSTFRNLLPEVSATVSSSSTTTPDSTGLVGTYTDIAIGSDGLPVVSYYDQSNSNLNILHCGNTACTSGNSTTTPDSTGTVGTYTSIAIGGDGFPVVSYYDTDNQNLNILHCGNVTCTSGNSTTTPDSTGSVGQYTSIAIGTDGYPVVAYYLVSGTLRVTKCGNATCTSGNTTTSVDATTNGQLYPSIAIGTDTYPIISYGDTGGVMTVVHCGNTACSSGNTTTVIDSGSTGYTASSIAIGEDTYPIVSYYDASVGTLKVAKCIDTFCTGTPTITTVDSTNAPGSYNAITSGLYGGSPVMAYFRSTGGDLTILECGDSACSGGNKIFIADSTQNTGLYTSIAALPSGGYVVSYYDSTNSDLHVYRSSVVAGGYSIGASNNFFSSIFVGNIYAQQTTVAGFDLAENYSSLDILLPGEIVSVDPVNTGYVKRARTGDSLLGVVSTKPGLVLANWNDKEGFPIALNGRVPVRVSTSTGDINIGDRIALSSVPGVGRKAIGEEPSIGIAMGSFSGEGIGTVEVFINLKGKEGNTATSTFVSNTLNVSNIGTGTVAYFANDSGTCTINPTTSSFSCSSDIRLKENVNIIASSTDIISRLRGVTFNWKNDSSSTTRVGFIAQEVQAIAPELVSVGPDGYLSVNYQGFAPYLVNAWNALDVRVSSLESIATSTLPATSTPMLAVTSTGLGIGTLEPAFALHAKFGGEGTAVFENENGVCEINPNTGSFGCAPSGSVVVATSTIGTSSASSTEILRKLRGVNLSLMSASTTVNQFGFLADDVELIAPELVSYVGGVKLVRTTDMIPLLVNSVNDLAIKVETLEDRVAKLENVASTTQASTTSATSTNLFDVQSVVSAVISSFQNMGTTIGNQMARFTNVFADQIVIGSTEKPAGITLYDVATRQPYCMRIQNGGQITTPGACSDVLFVSTTPTDGGTTDSTATSTSTPTADAGTTESTATSTTTPTTADSGTTESTATSTTTPTADAGTTEPTASTAPEPTATTAPEPTATSTSTPTASTAPAPTADSGATPSSADAGTATPTS